MNIPALTPIQIPDCDVDIIWVVISDPNILLNQEIWEGLDADGRIGGHSQEIQKPELPGLLGCYQD